MVPALFFRCWKPTLVLDQAAQIFDLTGVADVAVDDAGEPDAKRRQRLILLLVKYAIEIGGCSNGSNRSNRSRRPKLQRNRHFLGFIDSFPGPL